MSVCLHCNTNFLVILVIVDLLVIIVIRVLKASASVSLLSSPSRIALALIAQSGEDIEDDQYCNQDHGDDES